MDEAPDNVLVSRARQGSAAACDELIRRYQDRVYTVALGYLHDAIAAVPAAFRMVVILADIEGLSSGEIAEILRCPVNTVKTRLHRGRLAIRQRLEAYLKGEEDQRLRGKARTVRFAAIGAT